MQWVGQQRAQQLQRSELFTHRESARISSQSTAASLPAPQERFLFHSPGFHSLQPESVWICKQGNLIFCCCCCCCAHFKLAPRLRCWTPECVCGERRGLTKGFFFFFFFFLNGGGTCSGGVRAPRSGWESGAFVAKLWRWSCVHVCVCVWQIVRWGRLLLTPAPAPQPAPRRSGLWHPSAAVCKKVSSWSLIVFVCVFGAVFAARPTIHLGAFKCVMETRFESQIFSLCGSELVSDFKPLCSLWKWALSGRWTKY